jgi:hypothetical protein
MIRLLKPYRQRRLTQWQLLFSAMPCNGGVYRDPPEYRHSWPSDTWFRKRLALVRQERTFLEQDAVQRRD